MFTQEWLQDGETCGFIYAGAKYYLFIYLLPCKNLNCKSWWDIELCNADKIQAISFNKDKIDPINILE